MEHTPGPWKQNKEALIAINKGTKHIAMVNYDSEGVARCEANANLIAAAPDLLYACKLALGAFTKQVCIDWSVLEKAIRDAEGEA